MTRNPKIKNIFSKCNMSSTKDTMTVLIKVNGKLVYRSEELPIIRLRNLDDLYSKQEFVPYNISLGGGTQGLAETIGLNYLTPSEYILPLEKEYGGTFIGTIKTFKIFGCSCVTNTIIPKLFIAIHYNLIMQTGMIYYRATSPYKGDVTKNSSLSGSEIDNNFLTLEGRDIKAVRIEGNDLVVYLMNGDAVRTTELMKDYAKNLSFDFDAKSGVLTINNNGQITTLKGFKSKDEGAPEIAPSIAVDETLRGSGSFDNPLSVALNSRPGQYKPAKAFIDLCKKGNHCMPHHPEVGDRYVVAQEINNYGFLYDYNAVTAIACQLRDTHSPWRIPTKADWDDMLNAVEPSPEFRTHAQPYTNHTLGRFAGDILKAPDAWGEKHCHCDNDARFSDELEEEREKHMHDFDHHHDHHDYHRDHDCDDHCHDKPYCGELGKYHHKHCHGIPAHCVHSKYGFDVLPVGYTDDCRHYINCCERAAFWTATNSKGNSAYMKRFDNHCGGVHQDMIAAEHALSLRLIKDYDGLNYHECEDILGVPHTTVIMPSESKGSAIWTSVNLGIGDRRLRPIVPDYHNDEYANWHKFYFVAEWDGRMWVRAAIKEGETITIINTPDGRYNKCYRMVEGQLVDESQIVLEEVRDAISNDILVINKNIYESALAI